MMQFKTLVLIANVNQFGTVVETKNGPVLEACYIPRLLPYKTTMDSLREHCIKDGMLAVATQLDKYMLATVNMTLDYEF